MCDYEEEKIEAKYLTRTHGSIFLISKAVQGKDTISDLVKGKKKTQNQTLKKPSSLQSYLENTVAAFEPPEGPSLIN